MCKTGKYYYIGESKQSYKLAEETIKAGGVAYGAPLLKDAIYFQGDITDNDVKIIEKTKKHVIIQHGLPVTGCGLPGQPKCKN